MLQCSGCGELVSEYAARCPKCGRGVDDAVEVCDRQESVASRDVGAEREAEVWLQELEPVEPGWWGGSEGSEGAAAGDIEPAPGQSRHRSRGVVVVSIAVVVAAVAAIVSIESTGTRAASGLKGLDGRIVAESPSGQIVRVDPSSGATDRYNLSEPTGQIGAVASSPDGTVWLDSAGDEVNFSGTKIATIPTAIDDQIATGRSLARSETFTDRGQAVVVLIRTALRLPDAVVVTVKGGMESDLGTVDSAGGDLQSPGAFVSTPAQQDSPRIARSRIADTDVELRDAGEPPIVLATAAQLNMDVGLLPSTPIQLAVYPSPTGEAVAVVITPADAINGDMPMVILNREGNLLATLTGWSGPMYGTEPVWSPGGHEIAYPTYTTQGAALAITTETGSIETFRAPMIATTFGTCVWSPSSNGTVCQARAANREVWLYTTLSARRLLPGPGRGVPLAWIASSL